MLTPGKLALAGPIDTTNSTDGAPLNYYDAGSKGRIVVGINTGVLDQPPARGVDQPLPMSKKFGSGIARMKIVPCSNTRSSTIAPDERAADWSNRKLPSE